MKTKLYLVRLYRGYRFPEQAFSWRRTAHPPIIACFPTRELADAYVTTHLPLWQNPFDSYALYVRQSYGIEPWREDEDIPKEPERVVAWADFLATLSQLNLPKPTMPPNDDEDEVQACLKRWWDETELTNEQREALWRLIDPNPYRIDEVELEGTP